jgi:ABC-type ATPase involved in cell division
MRVEIKAGDSVRVTSQATIVGPPMLLLWINDRPTGHITSEQASALRQVVKDPGKIAIA